MILFQLLHLSFLMGSTTGLPRNSNSNHNRNLKHASRGRSRDHIPNRRDYLVQGLAEIEPAFAPFEDQGGVMYAGLIPTVLYADLLQQQAQQQEDKEDEEVGELMFWLFAPKKPKFDDTLLIWNNGGPGCSSLSGALFENSPVTIPRQPAGFFGIDETGRLEANPFAWTNATMTMYVEHPHGTGFTHGVFPVNETQVGRDFYNFLQNFYTIFEQPHDPTDATDPTNEALSLDHMRAKKLSFFGESYAGFYVPSIAYYIHEQNKKIQHQQLQLPIINLWGIALGNGWIDAQVQGFAVVPYAHWHGMIDSTTVAALQQEWEQCRDGSKPQPKPFHPFTTPDECGIMGAVMQAAGVGIVDWGGPNAYDVTTWDPYLMLDSKEGAISQFYNNPAVQDALHVVPHKDWSACMAGAGRRRQRHLREHNPDNDSDNINDDDEANLLPGQILLAHDQPLSMAPYLATLLDEAKIRVLIYNGDRDLTTNAVGTEMVLDAMSWNGAGGWADTEQFQRGLWFPWDKKFGGYMKAFRNLQFLVVYNSGHLVPFNEDRLALDLVTRFLGEQSFLDKALPKFKVSPKSSTSSRDKASDDKGTWTQREKPPRRVFAVGMGGVALITLLAFTSGFFISRRIPKARQGYEMVASH